MTDNVVDFEMLRVPSSHRHGQAGYFSLQDLPQNRSVASICQSTGWPELDEIFKIYPGQFVVCTGVAGHGKSTLLMNILVNMAKIHGTSSFMYVPENEQHIRNKLRGIWGNGHRYSDKEFELYAKTQCFLQSAMPDRWNDQPRTLQWVLHKAEIAIEKDNCDIVLIDPWNELERSKPKDQLMSDYIGECLMYLKQFCRAMRCTVIMVAHPTKAGVEQGKVPGLADIEGSMNWFNKCDNGLIVARDNEGNTARVISAKCREIGAGKRGACHFFVDPATGIFTPQYGAVSS